MLSEPNGRIRRTALSKNQKKDARQRHKDRLSREAQLELRVRELESKQAYFQEARDYAYQQRDEAREEAAAAKRTDADTGLLNKIAFAEIRARFLKEHKRAVFGYDSKQRAYEQAQLPDDPDSVEQPTYPVPPGFAFLDIQLLKIVNDGLGHTPAGDHVIKTLADRLEKVTRPEDYVFRLGGDEYGVLFRHLDRKTTDSFAKRVERKVNQPIYLLDGRLVSVEGVDRNGNNVIATGRLDFGFGNYSLTMSPEESEGNAETGMYQHKTETKRYLKSEQLAALTASAPSSQ